MSDDKPRYRSPFPKALSGCVEQLTRPLFKEQGLAGSRIISDWETIVGPRLSRYCIPERISFPKGKKTDGMLTIAAENGFATELQHEQPLILERLAIYFGHRAVTRIAISHSYLKPAPKAKVAKKTAREAIDSGVADGVEDAELKEALQSLARAFSE